MDRQENEDEVVEAMAKVMLDVYRSSSFNNHANMDFCRQQARVQYRAYIEMILVRDRQMLANGI